MKKTFSIAFGVLLFSVAWPAARAADYRPLDIKTGQWENTMIGQTSGAPPLPDELLNRLTPEQRAKLEAAVQSKLAEPPKPTVHKSCLTKDDLNTPYDFGDEAQKVCTHTILSSSNSRTEVRLDCNIQGTKSTGTVKVEAVDSEHVKGSMQMTMTSGDHTMNSNYTFTSKWLGPACTEKK